MKHLFFIFLFIIFVNIVGIMAVGFSPSSLIYELKQNEEECKMITLSSESEMIVVSDKWAENESVEWKVSLFDKDADLHDISIDYLNELSIDEREVEICLSGSEVGEYHGVILLREQQKGNSIVQMGVWLKVTIVESEEEVVEESIENPVSNGGSSGGGGGSSTTNLNLVVEDGIQEEGSINLINSENDVKETEEELEVESNAGITGAVVGGGNSNWGIIGIVMAIVLIAVVIVYNKRSKEYKI